MEGLVAALHARGLHVQLRHYPAELTATEGWVEVRSMPMGPRGARAVLARSDDLQSNRCRSRSHAVAMLAAYTASALSARGAARAEAHAAATGAHATARGPV